ILTQYPNLTHRSEADYRSCLHAINLDEQFGTDCKTLFGKSWKVTGRSESAGRVSRRVLKALSFSRLTGRRRQGRSAANLYKESNLVVKTFLSKSSVAGVSRSW